MGVGRWGVARWWWGNGGGGGVGDDDPGSAGRQQPAHRRDCSAEETTPTTYNKRMGEDIRILSLPKSATDLQLRTEDDDVFFDELGVTIPEFASLDAKLGSALTTSVTSGEVDKQRDLANTILAK